MSRFTYIAFPREADTTVLENGMTALKSYAMGELTWREDGKDVTRNSFNTEGVLVDCSKLEGGGFFHGLRIYDDDTAATFNNCFKNKYIYIFEGTLNYTGDPSLLACTSEFTTRMMKSTLINIELCRKQLCDLLIHNLHEGEFAEIYSEFGNHVNFEFGPPLNELILTTDEILFSEELSIKEKLRIEIRL